MLRWDWQRSLPPFSVGPLPTSAFADHISDNTDHLQQRIGVTSANALPLSIFMALHHRLRLVTFDLDPVFFFARLRQIVSGLPPQPELGVGPSCLLQSDGHLR